MPERIDHTFDPVVRRGHDFRYHLAAGFCLPGDIVLDAACGTGYGSEIVNSRRDLTYVGVDKLDDFESDGDATFISADLRTWTPSFEFDVAISFETIEHLTDYHHFIDVLKRARRWVLASVPVIPTTHINEFHAQDFAPSQLASVLGDEWWLFQMLSQPTEFSEIYVWKRTQGRRGKVRPGRKLGGEIRGSTSGFPG